MRLRGEVFCPDGSFASHLKKINHMEEKMEITNLTFIVTDECNFNCSYCMQKKEKKTISYNIIRTAVDFFYPFLKSSDKILIGFYGGEPLLAFDKIKYTVLLIKEKNKIENKHIGFTLTTNGSLLTGEMLEFFNTHGFALQLSFDGLAQEKSREKGSLARTLQVMKRIQSRPGISFEINSVFSPDTAGDFFDSLRFIIEQKGPDITFNFSSMENWLPAHLETLTNELERLVDYLALYYRKSGRIPVKNFQAQDSRQGISRCSAGLNHIAVTPEGKLWGCFLFHYYFKSREDDPQYAEYSFGDLNDFIKDYKTRYPGIMVNYSGLRQDFYYVEEEGRDCFLCPELQTCKVCPVNAAYTTGSLGKIPGRKCKLMKIEKNAGNLLNNILKVKNNVPEFP
ncbi:MAG: radical SAM protein [Candidatus Aminicenantes bacterium]|nr:radical SAM protein [Candidatus Aminicenantes bacterium]